MRYQTTRALYATISAFETYNKLDNGLWDRAEPESIASRVNSWLAANPTYKIVETPRLETRLFEISKDGLTRRFIVTASLLYVIDDLEIKRTDAGADDVQEEEISGITDQGPHITAERIQKLLAEALSRSFAGNSPGGAGNRRGQS